MSTAIIDPRDRELFGPDALPRLRLAAEEIGWMLSREYPADAVMSLVAQRHGLDPNQERVLREACCSDAQRRRRMARALEPDEDVAKRPLRIDACELVRAIETALAGGKQAGNVIRTSTRGKRSISV